MQHAEVPVPAPAKDEVLLKLEAASLNPVDWKIQKGMLRPLFPRKFPHIPGNQLLANSLYLNFFFAFISFLLIFFLLILLTLFDMYYIMPQLYELSCNFVEFLRYFSSQ